jgi:hypothetical protein
MAAQKLQYFRVLQSRKKENIGFEKDKSTRKNSQKILTG